MEDKKTLIYLLLSKVFGILFVINTLFSGRINKLGWLFLSLCFVVQGLDSIYRGKKEEEKLFYILGGVCFVVAFLLGSFLL
ncbi:MAG: hypothetical protein Q4Q07_09395 [Tissierellia bacterium]|nr:hypothetical protein [Tissierellia bacterium]